MTLTGQICISSLELLLTNYLSLTLEFVDTRRFNMWIEHDDTLYNLTSCSFMTLSGDTILLTIAGSIHQLVFDNNLRADRVFKSISASLALKFE